MFIRISLIVAIVAAITVASLDAIKLSRQIAHLTADREREKSLKEIAQRTLAATTAELTKTTTELSTTKSERDQAMARGDSEAQKGIALASALKAAQAELDKARNELAAWRSAPISVTDAKDVLGALKKVTEEREALQVKMYRLQARLAKIDPYGGEPEPVEIPRDLKGKVNISDPKYGFVVLDVGDDQGVFEGARLLVHRDGRLVAKVSVKSTEPNRSIANVLPGWQVAEIREGDQIVVQ